MFSVLLTARDHQQLLQLRTGASSALGGWRHGNPEACPHCGTLMGRQSEENAEWAITHLFTCPALPLTPLTPAALWEQHRSALARLKVFSPDAATP